MQEQVHDMNSTNKTEGISDFGVPGLGSRGAEVGNDNRPGESSHTCVSPSCITGSATICGCVEFGFDVLGQGQILGYGVLDYGSILNPSDFVLPGISSTNTSLVFAPDITNFSLSEESWEQFQCQSAPQFPINYHGVGPPHFDDIFQFDLSPSKVQAAKLPSPRNLPMTGFNCSFCMSSFTRDADRVRHENTTHLGQIHLCPIAGCVKSRGRGYSRADKVTEHLWKKHGDLGYVKRT